MAQVTPMQKLNSTIKSTVGIPGNLIRYLSTQPLLTGPLLYLLSLPVNHPARQRARGLASQLPYYNTLLSRLSPKARARLHQLLKALFVVGLLKRTSGILDSLALQYWYPFNIGRPRSPFVWDGKTELVLITGGCSGFGYEMVKMFAGEGHARVVVLDVTDLPPELAALSGVEYYRCDLTDFDAIASTAQQVKNHHGNPTVLVNNAGIGSGKTILDTPTPFLEAIMKVNLSSHFVLIKEFLPGMLEAKKGHVVTIASMASFVSGPGLVDYCVTKAGALALHEGLRNELFNRYGSAGHGISTTSVHPSWHRTGIIKGFEGRLAEAGIHVDPPSKVARAVVDQVLAGRSGQLFLPKEQIRGKNLRAQPLWLQDIVLGNIDLNPLHLITGKPKRFKLEG